MTAPLAGIRVIEAANWLAAPAGCALMADMGADVIKVEAPTGDPYRELRLGWVREDLPLNYPFQMDNRGKRSLTLDFAHPDSPALLQSLVKGADIFVTNLLPSRQERYGATYEILKAKFPELVYVAVSGYGPLGEDADRLGFDYAAFWARSGIMGLMGDPDSPPPVQRPGMGDHTTSLNVLAATLAALRRRDQTGRGLRVDVSLFATGLWTLASDLSCAVLAKTDPPRYARRAPYNPMWNPYLTEDDHWLLLVMPQPVPYWSGFCRAIGREQWIGDERYDTPEKRREQAPEMVRELDPIFAARPLAEWRTRLDAENLIWSPVSELPQVFDDPQVAHMAHIRTLEHPEAGPFKTLDTPIRIAGADIGPRGTAPELGQHTEEVLLEAGFDWEEIASLRDSGVLG